MILSQDRDRLANTGFLTSHSDFQLKGNQSYLDQIEEKDRVLLQTFVSEIGQLRGEELIRKAYLEYPHYASRSQIATKVLRSLEYVQVSQTWNIAKSSCLFTIGYEGMTIDAYLDVLVSNNVEVLIDVRKNPISMKYGFSKTKFSHYTNIAGITYIHIPDLGIPSNLRQGLQDEAAYQCLFDHYSSQILPTHKHAIEEVKAIVRNQSRVAITCFEADHQFCHRSRIAAYLENDPDFNVPIVHLSKDVSRSATSNDVSSQSGLWEEDILYSSI